MNKINLNIFEKLSYIDKCFAKGRFVNSSELSEKCNVSERTVYRYIDILRTKYNAPIEYDFKRKAFHYTKTFQLKEFDLSAAELFNLAVIFELLKSYDHNPYKTGQKSLLNKIRTAYGDEISNKICDVKEKISFRFSPVKKTDEKTFKIIEEALFKERTIELKYFKTDKDNKADRTIDPYHLRNYNGDWYLIGYEHERKKVRVLSVSRISGVKLTNRYFDVPDSFSMNEYFKHSFGKKRTSKPVKIELEIKKEFASIYREREIHGSQKTKMLRNGNMHVTLTLYELSEIKDWLMKEGTRIRVISPPELKMMIRKDAGEILKQYKDKNV
ncbi:MAG: transcriptional regulator [Ignavibacteria bacterium]|nr:transcriptional regulator [Ignavibacteria bacterium]